MGTAQDLQEVFKIKVSPDHLRAELWYNEANHQNAKADQWSKEEIQSFLRENYIIYGYKEDTINKLLESGVHNDFPLLIAEGLPPEQGKDGTIQYNYDTTTEVDRSAGYDFREVMRIPTVKEGEKIATLILPTLGKTGKSVYATEIKPKQGKPLKIRAGNHVRLNKETLSFYAEKEGQVSIAKNSIHVHNVYELTEGVSLKTGNIDFLGTVVIHGDVPTGFTVKSTGDIKVYGLVEGAELIADGSIYVSEGMAGLKQGEISAAENVHLSYINQGNVFAGNSVYVDRSILHSTCTAVNAIDCQGGNIIGGALSAGHSITAKDVGNRMNTITQITFGVDNSLYDRQQILEENKQSEEKKLRKLSLLKGKMSEEKHTEVKTRVMLLKLRKSYEQTMKKIRDIDSELETIQSKLGAVDKAYLSVNGTSYPNTIISYGKYRRKLKKIYNDVTIKMQDNEIRII